MLMDNCDFTPLITAYTKLRVLKRRDIIIVQDQLQIKLIIVEKEFPYEFDVVELSKSFSFVCRAIHR